jgi:hypothetical protein
MGQSRLHPSVADEAPFENTLTSYDERHLLVYADLLETEADGGDWDEAALLGARPLCLVVMHRRKPSAVS